MLKRLGKVSFSSVPVLRVKSYKKCWNLIRFDSRRTLYWFPIGNKMFELRLVHFYHHNEAERIRKNEWNVVRKLIIIIRYTSTNLQNRELLWFPPVWAFPKDSKMRFALITEPTHLICCDPDELHRKSIICLVVSVFPEPDTPVIINDCGLWWTLCLASFAIIIINLNASKNNIVKWF